MIDHPAEHADGHAGDGAVADGPSRDEALAALARVPWIRTSAAATRALLLRRARIRDHPAGAPVVRQGEPGEGMRVVVSGRLEMGTTSAAGRRMVVSYNGPGQVVGLAPLLDGRGAIHDAIAVEPARVLTVHADDLRAAIDADAELRWQVLGEIARRTRRLHAMLGEVAMLPLRVRLARTLLSLSAARDGGSAGPGEPPSVKVSQDGLASMFGIPRQRLNGELRALERDGVLRLAYRRIVLLDEAALRAQAEEPSG